MREICVLALLSLVQSASALPPKRLAADELPKGSVILEGKAPGYLLVKVKDGKVVGFEAATEKTGNVTVSFEKIKAGLLPGPDGRLSLSRFIGRLRYPAI